MLLKIIVTATGAISRGADVGSVQVRFYERVFIALDITTAIDFFAVHGLP